MQHRREQRRVTPGEQHMSLSIRQLGTAACTFYFIGYAMKHAAPERFIRVTAESGFREVAGPGAHQRQGA